MAMNANEALSLLQSMFDTWDRDSLITILQMNHGHVERTIEMILKMNGDSAEAEAAKQSNSSLTTSSSNTSAARSPVRQTENVTQHDSTTHGQTREDRKKRMEVDQLLARQLNMDEDNPRYQGSSGIRSAIAEANAELNSDVSRTRIHRNENNRNDNTLSASTSSRSSNKQSIQNKQGARRGSFIDLPTDYLQLPYHMYEALCLKRGEVIMDEQTYFRRGRFNSTPSHHARRGRSSHNQKPKSSSVTSAREKYDLELAMAMQQELLAQQIAEEERRQSSLGGMLGGLVSDAMDSLDTRRGGGGSWNHSQERTQNSVGQRPQTHLNNNNRLAVERQPTHRNAENMDRQPMVRSQRPLSSNVEDMGVDENQEEGGFSLAKATSFFSSISEDVKRKVNEVTVKFQTATGAGGYAMNDGTSCALEDDDDDDQPLVRNRNEARLIHRAGGGGGGGSSPMSSSSRPTSSSPIKDASGRNGDNLRQSSTASNNFTRRKGD